MKIKFNISVQMLILLLIMTLFIDKYSFNGVDTAETEKVSVQIVSKSSKYIKNDFVNEDFVFISFKNKLYKIESSDIYYSYKVGDTIELYYTRAIDRKGVLYYQSFLTMNNKLVYENYNLKNKTIINFLD